MANVTMDERIFQGLLGTVGAFLNVGPDWAEEVRQAAVDAAPQVFEDVIGKYLAGEFKPVVSVPDFDPNIIMLPFGVLAPLAGFVACLVDGEEVWPADDTTVALLRELLDEMEKATIDHIELSGL